MPVREIRKIFINDQNEIETIHSVLAENGINYVLDQSRLCFYCYDFFFHYLNEYLKSIIEAPEQDKREEIINDCLGYLNDCWIYKRLETADALW